MAAKNKYNLGILGGGQLGRMLALEARRFGLTVAVLTPEAPENTPQDDFPCKGIVDELTLCRYDDLTQVKTFGDSCNAITLEFENVPVQTVQRIESSNKAMHPNSKALAITQNRLLEKSFLNSLGIKTAKFAEIKSEADIDSATAAISLPAIIKTAHGGYDGKGQCVVRSKQDISAFIAHHKNQQLILEEIIDFKSELSIVAARTIEGNIYYYHPTVNTHRSGILFTSVISPELDATIIERARKIAGGVGSGLNFVGTFCVELFLTKSGELLGNEIAPRPHNSGHITIDTYDINQFEAQLRCVTGLPMHQPRQHSSGAMLNLLGDENGARFTSALQLGTSESRVKTHLYGKSRSVNRRKLGHFNIVSKTYEEVRQTLNKLTNKFYPHDTI